MLHIYVDADACPVKDEIYKVAQRYGLKVTLVANSYMRIPSGDWIDLVIVETDPDDPDRYRTPDGWREFVRENEIIACRGSYITDPVRGSLPVRVPRTSPTAPKKHARKKGTGFECLEA